MLGDVNIDHGVAFANNPGDVILQRISLWSWLADVVTATTYGTTYHPDIVGFQLISNWMSLAHDLRPRHSQH